MDLSERSLGYQPPDQLPRGKPISRGEIGREIGRGVDEKRRYLQRLHVPFAASFCPLAKRCFFSYFKRVVIADLPASLGVLCEGVLFVQNIEAKKVEKQVEFPHVETR